MEGYMTIPTIVVGDCILAFIYEIHYSQRPSAHVNPWSVMQYLIVMSTLYCEFLDSHSAIRIKHASLSFSLLLFRQFWSVWDASLIVDWFESLRKLENHKTLTSWRPGEPTRWFTRRSLCLTSAQPLIIKSKFPQTSRCLVNIGSVIMRTSRNG